MTFKEAAKLHNGDEVIMKKTGEVVTVLNTYTGSCGEKLCGFLEVCYYDGAYTTVKHTDVK